MKNKNRWMKISGYGLLIVVLMMVGLYVYGSRIQEKYPDFSSYNSKPLGTKALYLLTEQMGFRTARYERPSRFLPEKVILIAIKPDIDIFNQKLERKYLKSWLESGNTLLLVDDSSNLKKYDMDAWGARYEKDLNEQGGVSIYSVSQGRIYFMDNVERITNKGLKAMDPAVAFIEMLDSTKAKDVYFNEYFHGAGVRGITILDLLGQNGLLLLLQILLAVGIYLFVKSRRFGKPMVVFEIIKRQENENLFALAGMYMKAKAYSLVLELYLEFFKKQLGKYLGYRVIPDEAELLSAVSTNQFLERKGLRGVLSSSLQYTKFDKKDGRQLLHLISTLEQVRKEME
ncbi:MAG: DUF4350 domain-containing protein [Clostridia bacterium]|nr:DUF4350 domain-containing protein [Clostridia bacterium]